MKRLAAAIAAIATLACGAAYAQDVPTDVGPREGRWSWSLGAGIETGVQGEFHGAGSISGSLAGLSPALTGVTGALAIQSRDWDDVYDDPTVVRFDIARGFSPTAEGFGAVTWTSADANTLQIGSATPTGAAALPVFGRFGEYESISFEVGYRQYFAPFSIVTPYVAGRVGAVQTDAISATLTVPGAGVTSTVPFYDETTAFTGAIDLGLTAAAIPVPIISATVELGAEASARYTGELDGDDRALGGLGLGGLNEGEGRWSFPLMLTARVRY